MFRREVRIRFARLGFENPLREDRLPEAGAGGGPVRDTICRGREANEFAAARCRDRISAISLLFLTKCVHRKQRRDVTGPCPVLLRSYGGAGRKCVRGHVAPDVRSGCTARNGGNAGGVCAASVRWSLCGVAGIVYPVDRIGVLLRRTCVRSAGCRKIVFSPETSSAAATSCRPAEGERRALGRYFVRTGDERPGTGTDAGLHAPKSAARRYGLHRTVRRKSEQQFAPLHLGDHPVDLLPDCFGECRARHFDHLAGRDGAYRAALFHR